MPISLDDVRARISRLTAPISDAAPGGSSPSGDARYDFVRNELARLESPSGGLPDWSKVVSEGSDLLAEKSKEYLTAIYVAYSMFQARGVNGLTDGLMLLSELEANFWATMFPELKRVRGRVNALTWFIEKLVPALPELKVTRKDRDEVNALQEVSEHFITVTREKFENNAPAFGPLREAVGRIVSSLPAEAPPPPPPPPPKPVVESAPETTEAETYQSEEATTYSPEASETYYGGEEAGGGGGVGDLASAEGAAEWFTSVGDSLGRASAVLRAANPQDANAYRVLRQGAWMRFVQAPLDENGALTLEGPDASVRQELVDFASQQQWGEFIERCEALTLQFPLWLDLQRHVADAMGTLGEEWEPARSAVVTETAAFLRRMPLAVGWRFTDGGETADAETRRWLTREAGATSSGALTVSRKDPFQAAVLEAQSMVEQGDVVGAIAKLQRRVNAATSAPARFKARLAVAKIAAQGGQQALARALFEHLEREVTAHGLEDWEPALASECLEGLIVALRGLAEAGIALPGNVALMYDRLCRVDPAAAARIGG